MKQIHSNNASQAYSNKSSRAHSNNLSDDARHKLLAATLPHIPFDGWTSKSLRAGTASSDLPQGGEELYFPGGPLEMISFWNTKMDTETALALQALDLANMKIRDKVTQGVLARLSAIGNHEDAARRAIARTALPDGLAIGPKVLWAAADNIWRSIGDTSTDFNYYSKRTVLSAVISSSAAAWLSDDEFEKTKARAFLDARIANVMQFEAAKFKAKKRLANLPDPAEVLGMLRYGRKRHRRRG